MKTQFFKTLVEKRFQTDEKKKKKVNKNTITEFNTVDKLAELLLINKVKIQNCKQDSQKNNLEDTNSVENLALFENEDNIVNSSKEDMEKIEQERLIEEYVEKYLGSLSFDLSIPPRVPYENIDKKMYKEIEQRIFNHWKKVNNEYIFERNLEVWRQFWITCEKSDVIVQVIDGRNPYFFINEDIRKVYSNKKHIIFTNKSDLCKKKFDIKGYDYFYYSALGSNELSNFIDNIESSNIGLIGYPNVGKSSTINMLIKKKKVQVSQTPGKTRYIQTIVYEGGKKLYDCPGLVFPKHSKVNLLLHGILNVDKMLDLKSSLYDIIKFIGIGSLLKHYKLPTFINDSRYPIEINFINHMADIKNLTIGCCLKTIVKDLVSGKIQYDKIQEQLSLEPDYSWCNETINGRKVAEKKI